MTVPMSLKHKIFIAVALVALVVVIRLVPHLWNAAPVAAIGLFAGVYLGRSWALVLPVLAMFISDIFIGFDTGWVTASVYLSFILAGAIGIAIRHVKSPETVLGASILASVFFYLITNWAVWQFGTMYPPTVEGLLTSYTLALPFFRNTLAGDLFYTAGLFGAYESVRYLVNAARVRRPSLVELRQG